MSGSLTRSVKLLTPPVVPMLFNGVRSRIKGRSDTVLFDGDDDLFKRTLAAAVNYAEYGCGKSTVWVAKNTTASIHSVDSNLHWIELVRKRIGDRAADLRWVDCGPLGDWGAPISFQKRENFKEYAQWAWSGDIKPDTILIDGRFRVCCFLTSLKFADEGTRILFDDYTNRPHYQIAEEFVPRHETCGRQCLFIVPRKDRLDYAELDRMIEKFEYVTN